jgi:hypothetical protein
LLQQIAAENLPSQFGGTCQCNGGCELSDAGPWQDPQWLGPQEKAAGKTEETSTATTSSTEPITPAPGGVHHEGEPAHVA